MAATYYYTVNVVDDDGTPISDAEVTWDYSSLSSYSVTSVDTSTVAGEAVLIIFYYGFYTPSSVTVMVNKSGYSMGGNAYVSGTVAAGGSTTLSLGTYGTVTQYTIGGATVSGKGYARLGTSSTSTPTSSSVTVNSGAIVYVKVTSSNTSSYSPSGWTTICGTAHVSMGGTYNDGYFYATATGSVIPTFSTVSQTGSVTVVQVEGGTIYWGTSTTPTGTSSNSSTSAGKYYVRCVADENYTFSSWSASGAAYSTGTTSASGGYFTVASGGSVTLTASFTFNLSPTATASSKGTLSYTGSSQTGVTGSNVTWTGTTSATASGTYTAYATPASGYSWSDKTTTQKTFTWAIGSANSGSTGVSTDSMSVTYGSSNTRAVSGNTGTVSVSSSDTSVATVGISGSTITVTAVGNAGTSCTITCTAAASGSYLSATSTFTVTIAKASGSTGVSTSNMSVTYGGSSYRTSSATGTLSVSSSNTSVATVKISNSRVYVYAKGNYNTSCTITCTAAASTNYNAATSTFKVTITRASATISGTLASGLTYTGNDQALVTALSVTGGGTLYTGIGSTSTSMPSSWTAWSSGSCVGNAAGTYYVWAESDASTNYKAATKYLGTVTIAEAVSISIPTPTNYSGTYDGSAHGATFSSCTGASITSYRYSTDNSTWTTSSSNPTWTNAGTYYAQAYYTASSGYTGSGWSSSATITITKKIPTITVSMSGYTYGGTKSTPSVSGNSGSGTVTYYYNTSNSNSGGTLWSNVTSSTYLSVGTYYMYAVVAATTNYTSATSATKSFTISAPSVTVTFNKNGGSGGTDSTTITYGTTVGNYPSITLPTRTGYSFTGYYDASSGGTQYYNSAGNSVRTFDKYTATTLYAQWTVNSYTLTWNADGGSLSGGTSAGSVAYGTALTAPTATRTGYTFAGWSPTVPSTMPASNATYTATWTANSVTIPTAKSLTYTGSAQTGVNNYNSSYMTYSGTISATNAGTYSVTFTIGSNYIWSDGTTTNKTVSWTIAQAAQNSSFSISPTSSTIYDRSGYNTVTITASNYYEGPAYSSSDTSIATVSSSGVVTYVAAGTATITVTVGGTNYKSASKTCTITCKEDSVSSKVRDSYTYKTPVVDSVGEGNITAGGGSVGFYAYVQDYETYHYVWKSGYTESTGYRSGNVTGEVEYDVSSSAGTWTLDNTTLTHGDMKRNVRTETCTVIAFNAGDSSKSVEVGTWSVTNSLDTTTQYSSTEYPYPTGYNIYEYGTPTLTLTNNLTAAGGSVKAVCGVTNTTSYYNRYTSGCFTDIQYGSVSGTAKWRITSNGNSRFVNPTSGSSTLDSMTVYDSGLSLTHNSMTTNVTTDTVKVTAYNSGNSSKTVTSSSSVSNKEENTSYNKSNYAISNLWINDTSVDGVDFLGFKFTANGTTTTTVGNTTGSVSSTWLDSNRGKTLCFSYRLNRPTAGNSGTSSWGSDRFGIHWSIKIGDTQNYPMANLLTTTGTNALVYCTWTIPSTGTFSTNLTWSGVQGGGETYAHPNSGTEWSISDVKLEIGSKPTRLINAAGGSATVYCTGTHNEYTLYTSGSTSAARTITDNGTLSVSNSISNISSLSSSASGATLSHSSMTTNARTESITITGTNGTASRAMTIYVDNTLQSQHYKDTSGTTGDNWSYGQPTTPTVTNNTNANWCSGGSGTLSSTVTDTKTYYQQYDSGSYTSLTTENPSGTVTFVKTSDTCNDGSTNHWTLSGSTITNENMECNWVTHYCTIVAKNYNDTSQVSAGNLNLTASNTRTESNITYYASCSIGSGLTASGGSATVSYSGYHTANYKYVSGSTDTELHTTTGDGASIVISSQTFTPTGGGASSITRFSLSGSTLSHTTMGTNVGTDNVVVTATNSVSSTGTTTASKSLTNDFTLSLNISSSSVNYNSSISNVSATASYTSGSTVTLSDSSYFSSNPTGIVEIS